MEPLGAGGVRRGEMALVVETGQRAKRRASMRLLALSVMLLVFASGCSKEMVLDNLRPMLMPTLARYGMADRFEEIFGAFALAIANWMTMQLARAGINF